MPPAAGLDIQDDERFARREWFIERIGWLLMLTFIVLGLVGVLGNGPISAGTAKGDGFQVSYQRFTRNQGQTTIEVDVQSAQPNNGEIEIWLPNSFMRTYDLDHINPEPDTTRSRDGGVAYVFDVSQPSAPLQVSFHLVPGQVGRHTAQVTVANSAPASFHQFVYP